MDLPISENTKNGKMDFTSKGSLNEIFWEWLKFKDAQFRMLLLEVKLILIKGDILGASKTGSGKTLAYIIPLIEKLYL